MELSSATLTSLEGCTADDADLTLKVDRSALEEVMIGQRSLQQLVLDGTAKLSGDGEVLTTLGSMLVHFET